MNNIAIKGLFAALALCCSLSASAHALSTNYLFVQDRGQPDVRAHWDIGARDLSWAIGLDTDQDGRVLWSEVLAQRAAIAQLAAQNLNVRRAGMACNLQLQDLLLTRHAGESHVALQLAGSCPTPGRLEISSTLFLDQDASQKTLLDAVTPAGHFNSLLASSGEWWAEPRQTSWLSTLGEFVGQGMWHVWIGYDHIAFLLLLLLPSVLRWSTKGWQAAASGRQAIRDLLIIVTAFTLAHSVTLALAATGTARPPVRLIEASIALSIVAAAILNLFPGAARWRLALAFGFGLMHGFGFANALAELGAGGVRLIPALAGFNIGVELAQLSIVLLVFPWLLRARSSSFYVARFMPATTIVIAVMGAVWLAQRM